MGHREQRADATKLHQDTFCYSRKSVGGAIDQSVGSGGEKELLGPSQGLGVEFIHDGLYRDDVGWLGMGRGLKLESLDLSQAV